MSESANSREQQCSATWQNWHKSASSIVRLLLWNAILAGTYWRLAVLVKEYFFHYQMWPAPLWVPAGVALFAVLSKGPSMCFGIVLGSFFTNTITFGEPLDCGLLVGLGNALGPLIAAKILEGRIRSTTSFSKVSDALYFTGAAFLSGMISGAIALPAVLAGNHLSVNLLVARWFDWTLSDCAASMTVTPLLLLWVHGRSYSDMAQLHAGQMAVSTALTTAAVIYMLFGHSGQQAANAGSSFLILLPLLWIAVRMSLGVGYLVFVGVMATTISGTMAGNGPFSDAGRGTVLVVFAQMAIGFGGSMLLLGAAANEQRSAANALQKLNADLERRVDLRTAALKASQERLEKAALYDSLTGLCNRRLLEERFQSIPTGVHRSNDRLALLLIDLDYFKEINDNFGHDAGDALLVEVGCRLTTSVREGDTVARMGGDEFAVLLGHVESEKTIERVCTRILYLLNLPMLYGERELHTNCSIGAAFFPEHGTNWLELYKAADQALYSAKRNGRNTVRFATDVKESAAVEVQSDEMLVNGVKDAQLMETIQRQ